MPPSAACDENSTSAARATAGCSLSRPYSAIFSSARSVPTARENFADPSVFSGGFAGNAPFFSCFLRNASTSG